MNPRDDLTVLVVILTRHLISKLTLVLVICLATQGVFTQQRHRVTEAARLTLPDTFCSRRTSVNPVAQEEKLVFPGLLKKEALESGNPLATYAAMLDLEPQYQKSKIFSGIYPEVRFNFEEFLGFPLAGLRAMSLAMYRRKTTTSVDVPTASSYRAEDAIKVIEREARKTRLVIWGEEHHLPQTRSLYEAMLRVLWREGYRYLAAETFDDKVMSHEFEYPDYQSGYYIRDPIFRHGDSYRKRSGLQTGCV